ncbi:unnamed protein product [Cuscuta europaea]|uniref:Uncharacterized protein n=1 Tax=Cuscuta europaea TaxID=41803 RepID=A0A9P0Z5K3_CUSEU|nr:unnamed protein product [Cuscuta europaea]
MSSFLRLCWIIIIISHIVLVPTSSRRAHYILGEDFRSPEILSEDSVYASRAVDSFVSFLCRCIFVLAVLELWTCGNTPANIKEEKSRCCHERRIEDDAQGSPCFCRLPEMKREATSKNDGYLSATTRLLGARDKGKSPTERGWGAAEEAGCCCYCPPGY